jgi:glutaredoxin 3
MKNIIYTKPGCWSSAEVKKLLDRLAIPYEERLIASAQERETIKAQYHWRTFPIVILNGRMIGGYQDTQALADHGKIAELLKE